MSDKYCHDCWWNFNGGTLSNGKFNPDFHCHLELSVKECKKEDKKEFWGGRKSLGSHGPELDSHGGR